MKKDLKRAYKVGQVVDFAVGYTEDWAKVFDKTPGVKGKGKIIKIKYRRGKGPIFLPKPHLDYFIQHETIDAMGNKKYKVWICDYWRLGKIHILDTWRAAKK